MTTGQWILLVLYLAGALATYAMAVEYSRAKDVRHRWLRSIPGALVWPFVFLWSVGRSLGRFAAKWEAEGKQ